jgi:hypothetical protein
MALTRPRYSQIPDSDYKNSCRIVTTTDIALGGGSPLEYDGVTLIQYDRVLVTGQSDATQNGIYSVTTLGTGSNGTWARSKDANANDRLTAGMNTFIEEGTYTGQFWHLLTPGPIVLGVTELVFGQISGNAAGISSQVQYNEAGSIAGAANLRYDSATGNVVIGGGTVSTSNVTGALTVNGGIGVTGEIWAQGNIYSVGSRVLTSYDLQTRIFTANYISKDPANVYVPTVGTGTIYGTHNFGNLEAISTYGDYNTTAQSGYYSVNDASGAPGFIVYVGFTGITSFNRAVFNINYTQQSGHTITLDFYNYDTDAWDPFATYSGLGNWQAFTLGVIDANPYIDAAGNVTTRVYHVSSGTTTHRTWIDYVALEQSITGGQGPRGPAGATGPSGTYSGGFISGIIVTGNNIITSGNFISNSGNVSNSTTTGALVLTGNGGAGIGGNIFAGGNVTANAFYTLNGLFWSGNGLAFSSGLEVSEINAANTLSNISSQVTSLRFDKDTGFSVTELDPGNVKISLGSSFKTWHVPGQADLVAAAEDEVTFFGNGIDITTNPTFPKAITFIANNSILEANIGAFYNYANANIGTLYLGNISTQANLGAFQTYSNLTIAEIVNNANANVAAYLTTTTTSNIVAANINTGNIFANSVTITGNINIFGNIITSNVYTGNIISSNVYTGNIVSSGDVTIDGNLVVQSVDVLSNIGAFYNYANANIGTLYLGNISTQANLGAFYNYANANIGAFYNYANANIGTLYLGNISTQANLGAFQTYTNIALDATILEINSVYNTLDSNAASQANSIIAIAANLNTIAANIGAFGLYANTKIGNNSNSNLVVRSTDDSISAITGALVVAGGAGIGGNLYVAGNIFASNLISINSTTLSVQDPLLYLSASDPFPYNYDIGFFSHYARVSGEEQHTGLVRDYTTNIWNFFSNVSANPGTTINWYEANLIYDTVRLGELIVSNTTTSTSTTTGAITVAGGVGIAGELYINNTGDVSANIGTLYLGNVAVNANLGQYQTWANAEINTINTNASNFQNIVNANLGVSTTFSVTNSGTSHYLINTETNPELYLIRGLTYNFVVDAAGHPFWIKTYPSIGVGDQYNDGVTNNGQDNGTISFLVPLSAPNTLYYISQYESELAGQFNVIDFSELYANIGTLYLGNTSINANLGAFQTYTNTSIATLDSNIGTLFLGNESISVNFDAFRAYANTKIGTNSGSNLVVVATTTSTSTTTGALVVNGGVGVAGNVVADKFYTTTGIYWAGNGQAYSSGSAITYTASTTPPVSPTVGDQWYDTADAILYEYMDDGDTNQWVDIITPTFSAESPTAFSTDITFASNILVDGNIFITDGIFWSVNSAPYSTGGGGGGGTDDVLRANVGAYQIYANANIGTLFLGNISTQANLGTLFLGNATTNANLGAYQTWANSNFGTSTYSNTNVAAYLTRGANIGSGTTTSNLVANATTTSTSTTTGALVVRGGAGVAGNIISGGNIVAASGTASTTTTSGALVVVGGAGISGAVHVGSSGSFAGLLQTTASNPATSTSGGALYVAGGAGIIGNLYVGGNVVLGSGTSSNLVVNATTTSANITSGALIVKGGAGIAGAAYIGGNAILGSSTTSTNVVVTGTRTSTSTTTGALVVRGGVGVAGNITVGGDVTIVGALSGGVGYLLERANVVTGSASDITNVDLFYAPVMYWTANCTANVTANIRGSATTPLNSTMAVNQTATLALFLPIGNTPYYVETVKIDNTTVTPVWLNGNTVLSGNANSIDVYTFTIIKTASATYKVFATQSMFQHTG